MSATWFLLLLVVLLAAPTAKAGADDPREIAAHLQSTYDRAAGLSADFEQVTTLDIMKRKRFGSGTLLFRKPGFMRWDYLAPDRLVLISDGKTFSIYNEKEHQLIITSAKEYLQSDVTYSFFAGTGNVLRDFEVSMPAEMENEAANTYLLKLVPKTLHPQVDHLYVWITPGSFVIKRLRIVSHTDSVTDLTFSHIKIYDRLGEGSDSPLGRDAFIFIPPPGTEVIEQ